MTDKIDKSKVLRTSIGLMNDKLHFKGLTDGRDPISIDYIPPLGDDLGYTSLELFLLSLSSCVGSAMLIFLRRMNRTVSAFDISAVGVRKEVHPTGFKDITLELNIVSGDVTEADLNKVIGMMDSYCPVSSMLKDDVKISYRFNIVKQQV